MKRLSYWMTMTMMLLLAVTLTACGENGEAAVPKRAAESTPSAAVLSEDSEESTVPLLPPEEKIFYTVTMNTQDELICAQDGSDIFTGRFQLPTLTAFREDGTVITEPRSEAETAAADAVETFNLRFTDWATDEGLQEMADNSIYEYGYYLDGETGWIGPYDLDFSCSIYQTRTIISVLGTYYSYSGGAHPNTMYLAWNFDLEDGSFFGAEVLGDGTALRDAVTEELIRQSQEMFAEYDIGEFYWQDYEMILADWSSYTFSFDETGMTVTFSPYELAAYAAGAQIFEIPYDFLRPYLSAQGLALLGLDAD